MNKDKHIPQGYKDSPLGIIPKEWEVKRLGDSFTFKQGVQFPVQEQYLEYKTGLIRFIRIVDLTQSDEPPRYVKDPGIQHHISEQDLFMIRYGTPGVIGYGYVGVIANNLFRLIPKQEIDKYYFYQYFKMLEPELMNLSCSSSMAAINFSTLERIYLRYPTSLQEQNRVSNILRTWDTAIEKQSELIEKLKLRKRALMQQLLTGKKRLPGFCGEWKEVKLGDVFDERNETNRDDLPLLSITGDKGVIYQSDSDKRDISNDDKSKYKRICPNDIGYNTMRMWQGRSALSELEGIVSPAYTIVTPRESINVKFMSMLIQQPRVVYDFWTHSQGLVSDTLNCKYPDFCQVKVRIPTKQEQTAIASVLVKADKEIELAKDKLASLQSQKRGLMQQLLTGKNRII